MLRRCQSTAQRASRLPGMVGSGVVSAIEQVAPPVWGGLTLKGLMGIFIKAKVATPYWFDETASLYVPLFMGALGLIIEKQNCSPRLKHVWSLYIIFMYMAYFPIAALCKLTGDGIEWVADWTGDRDGNQQGMGYGDIAYIAFWGMVALGGMIGLLSLANDKLFVEHEHDEGHANAGERTSLLAEHVQRWRWSRYLQGRRIEILLRGVEAGSDTSAILSAFASLTRSDAFAERLEVKTSIDGLACVICLVGMGMQWRYGDKPASIRPFIKLLYTLGFVSALFELGNLTPPFLVAWGALIAAAIAVSGYQICSAKYSAESNEEEVRPGTRPNTIGTSPLLEDARDEHPAPGQNQSRFFRCCPCGMGDVEKGACEHADTVEGGASLPDVARFAAPPTGSERTRLFAAVGSGTSTGGHSGNIQAAPPPGR